MAFPETGLLSEFDPPAENPLSESGNWGQFFQNPPMQKNASNEAGQTVVGPVNYSFWTPQMFTGDAEVWACISGGQLGAALESWRVALWTTAGVKQGYLALYGGAIGKFFELRRYTDDLNFTSLAVSGGGYPDRLGLRINGTAVEVWAAYGGVWALQLSFTDTTYRGGFYLSIGTEDPTGGGLSISCFGGGRKNRTQIFRWLSN